MTIHLNSFIFVYCCVLTLLFGAVVGSFLHCAAWRISRGESFVRGRSRCPVCGAVLAPRDLVPVVSYLVLRGRCRSCHAPIPARYPLSEGFCALMSLVCLLRFDLTVLGLRNWLFLCCLFLLSLTDLDAFLIPDGCLLFAAAVWVLSAPFLPLTLRGALSHAAAGLTYGAAILAVSLLLDRLLGRESLGGGDVKLIALSGLYLGWVAALFAVILSCVLGLLFLSTRRERAEAFPFGPSIAAATAVMLFFGDGLAAWYLGLLGLS